MYRMCNDNLNQSCRYCSLTPKKRYVCVLANIGPVCEVPVSKAYPETLTHTLPLPLTLTLTLPPRWSILLISLTSQSLGLLIGANVINPQSGQTIAVVIQLGGMLCGEWRGGGEGEGGRGGEREKAILASSLPHPLPLSSFELR